MLRSSFVSLLVAASLVSARGGPHGDGPGGRPPGPGRVEPRAGERIVWFGTLASARAEAARTKRPIFLVSAAPQCHDVPGIW